MRKLLIFLSVFSFSASANLLYKTINISEATVITPSLIEFVIPADHTRPSGVVTLKLMDIDFDAEENILCKKHHLNACERLQNLFEKNITQLHLKAFDHESQHFSGDVYVGGEKLTYMMVSKGWYKFDYKQTRNKYYVFLQKMAMCKGLGIWSGESSMLDEMCN